MLSWLELLWQDQRGVEGSNFELGHHQFLKYLRQSSNKSKVTSYRPQLILCSSLCSINRTSVFIQSLPSPVSVRSVPVSLSIVSRRTVSGVSDRIWTSWIKLRWPWSQSCSNGSLILNSEVRPNKNSILRSDNLNHGRLTDDKFSIN